jgi:hypothetical protein
MELSSCCDGRTYYLLIAINDGTQRNLAKPLRVYSCFTKIAIKRKSNFSLDVGKQGLVSLPVPVHHQRER